MLLLLSHFSHVWLCDPIEGSPPGSPVLGILQARTMEWVAISFSNAGKGKVKVKLLSHVQLSAPMDCSLPGSSIHGIFQARVLEWGAIAFSSNSIVYLIRPNPLPTSFSYILNWIATFYQKTLQVSGLFCFVDSYLRDLWTHIVWSVLNFVILSSKQWLC